jgi:S1-C subfamily serine protease
MDQSCPVCRRDITAAGAAAVPATFAGGRRHRRYGNYKYWILGAAGGTLAIVLATVAGIALFSSQTSPTASGIVLDWPVNERSEGSIFIDGYQLGLPQGNPAEYRLQRGFHRVSVLREGYVTFEATVTLKDGDRYYLKPQWALAPAAVAETSPPASHLPQPQAVAPGPTSVPPAAVAQAGPPVAGPGIASKPPGSDQRPKNVNPSFDAWLQDFEAAKRKAAGEHKDILIAFDGSDWCGWSIRLAYEVFFQPDFRQRVEQKYVLLFIDFPKKPEARAKVQNAARNQRLMEHFEVEGFPTVVLTDADGLPYGRDGYVEGGVNGFIDHLSQWQHARTERDALFQAVEAARGADRLKAVENALRMLQELGMLRQYAGKLDAWAGMAEQDDPQNQKGIQEALFEVRWMLRLQALKSPSDAQALLRVVEELDAWKKKHRFQDPDRAARLHLLAAILLAAADDPAASAKYVQQGLSFRPKNPMLRERLQTLATMARALAAGSGFLVAPGGYVLTNHHVVHGEGKLVIQFSDVKDPLPARRIADDDEKDIALLKVELPAGLRAQPLPLAAEGLSRGTKVGAFGFPLGGAMGSGLKLTTGVVSATPDQTPTGMLLLDCRINPGNSGGPLCDARGNVVGMVTAKSFSTSEIESYGMALPAGALRSFMALHLANYKPQVSPAQAAMEWDAIDRRISSSVVMVIRRR